MEDQFANLIDQQQNVDHSLMHDKEEVRFVDIEWEKYMHLTEN